MFREKIENTAAEDMTMKKAMAAVEAAENPPGLIVAAVITRNPHITMIRVAIVGTTITIAAIMEVRETEDLQEAPAHQGEVQEEAVVQAMIRSEVAGEGMIMIGITEGDPHIAIGITTTVAIETETITITLIGIRNITKTGNRDRDPSKICWKLPGKLRKD